MGFASLWLLGAPALGKDTEAPEKGESSEKAALAKTERKSERKSERKNEPKQEPQHAASSPEALPAPKRKALNAAIRQWAKAWSKRDVKTYLGAYAPGFVSADRTLSHDNWAEQRRSSLRSSGTIDIQVTELEWAPRGEDWVASFMQTSQIDGRYHQVRKQLLLRKYKKRWLIIGEREDS